MAFAISFVTLAMPFASCMGAVVILLLSAASFTVWLVSWLSVAICVAKRVLLESHCRGLYCFCCNFKIILHACEGLHDCSHTRGILELGDEDVHG
jgi:hypothetical protein